MSDSGMSLNPYPRCLMVATGAAARTTGYSIRVWTALRAVRSVQGDDAAAPVLLSFESLRDWRHPSTFEAARAQAAEWGVELVCMPSWPKKLPGSVRFNRRWQAAVIRRAIRRWKPGVVHAQSHMPAGACAMALRGRRNPQLVFDVHGVDIEESLADGRLRPGSRTHRLRRDMQAEASGLADWTLPASRALGNYLLAENRVTARTKVVPCVLTLPIPEGDLECLRREARRQLHVGDRPVVLYLGGASAWQRPEFTVGCFRELLVMLPEAVMLIVTGDVETFTQLLRQAGIGEEHYRVCSLPHHEVARTAVAADVGLLLREDTLVNRVASPTKFAEYLALGVPVVLTDVLCDFAELVQSESVGAVVASSATTAKVAEALETSIRRGREEGPGLRRRCQVAYRQSLSFESILPIYREVYGAQVLRREAIAIG